MRNSALLVFSMLVVALPCRAEYWPLEEVNQTLIARGTVESAEGAMGRALVLDGSSLLELKESAGLTGGSFTVSFWFNPYQIDGGQQMLAGKNRYALKEREWSLTVEPDGKLRAHLQQDGWRTISSAEPLKAGSWHFAVLVIETQKAALFLNGRLVGELKLLKPVPVTEAPITLGGIWDGGSVRQPFHGALDEFTCQSRAMSGAEVAANYQPVLRRCWPI